MLNSPKKPVNSSNFSEELLDELEWNYDLFGNPVVTSFRGKKSAGRSAAETGALFESAVSEVIHNAGLPFEKKPKYTDYCNMEEREGDFKVFCKNGAYIWIEAKQLGNCESHTQKLAYIWLNSFEGAYGSHFILVYDYDISSKNSQKHLSKLQRYVDEKWIPHNRAAGRTVDFVYIGDLEEYLEKYNNV
tara:strand:- start:43 stop:609 length:567 start_codon:yes stop_codon:yes gene_type:complete